MAQTLLATVYSFDSTSPAGTRSPSYAVDLYSTTNYFFDEATLTVLPTPGNTTYHELNGIDNPPANYYLAAGEIYSYCAGMDRHPWQCDGVGGAYASAVEPNAEACGATPRVFGCTNPAALNYNASANEDDGSCVMPPQPVNGCTNPRARNYDPAATQDDGSCQFGPTYPVEYNYDSAANLTVVFNETLGLFITEQTYRPQMLLPIEGKGYFTLPLPGQSGDAPVQRYLWEHNAGPEVNPLGTLRLYGRVHPVWVEVVVLGSGEHMVKNVDNFVLVSNEELPVSVAVTAPEQGSFTQTFITSGHRLSLTCRRQEQLTYAVLEPPKDGIWGGRVRAKWVRLRFAFAATKQLRLSNLIVLLRESVS